MFLWKSTCRTLPRLAAALACMLAACDGGGPSDTGVPCARGASPRWVPQTEEGVREDALAATWDGPATTATCDGTACLHVAGRASTSVVVERGVPHRLTVARARGSRVRVEARAGSANGTLLARADLDDTAPAADLAFTPTGARTVVLVVDGVDADLAELELRAEAWTEVDPGPLPPEAALLLGVLVHLEAEPALRNDAAIFQRRADVLAALSGTLARHGARLGIQADQSFAAGVAAHEPGWVRARLDEGAGFSIHVHADSPDTRAFLSDVRTARQAWEAVGVEVADLNGGFQVASWDEVARAGVGSLSAWKDAANQGGLPEVTLQPWRPASYVTDGAAFQVHEASGPLVYLPGSPSTEPDPTRFAEAARRTLSQALAHVVPGHVNTWYLVLHVDNYGRDVAPSEWDAWRAGGGLDAELAPLDAWLGEVAARVDRGEVRWSTPDSMREAYLAWESACDAP